MNKKIIQRISLLILLFVLPIAYPVTDIHAQDVRVTIRMEKVRMEQVMNEIERQTKYLFGSAENVDVKRIVTVQVVNRPLQEALDAMLRGTNVSYTVQGSNIVLKNGRSEAEAKKPAVISGVVRDAAGNPVVGAAVVVKGTTIGISTDSEGRFSLQVPPPASQAVLEINYLGYAPADVRVGSATRFDITLKEDSQQISDVLVVGYTPMRKSDFTGSIASVKASELTTTTPTMAQALAGKVAGALGWQRSAVCCRRLSCLGGCLHQSGRYREHRHSERCRLGCNLRFARRFGRRADYNQTRQRGRARQDQL